MGALAGCANPTSETGSDASQQSSRRTNYAIEILRPTTISVFDPTTERPDLNRACKAYPKDVIVFGALRSEPRSFTLLKSVSGFEKQDSSDESSSNSFFPPVFMSTQHRSCDLAYFKRYGDSLFAIDEMAYMFLEEDARTRITSDTDEPEDEGPGVCKLQYPLRQGTWSTIDGGRFRARRSYAGGHSGHDFAPFKYHESIFAAAAGEVFKDPNTGEPYGNRMSIAHAPCDERFAFKTFYAHNSRNVAAYGAQVEKGELIAYTGNTGSASRGEHLHFDLENHRKDPSSRTGSGRNDGFFVNPIDFLVGYPK